MSDLISRDAAIATIETVKRDFPETDFSIDNSARIGLPRATLEVSTLPPPWVSVNDRLPDVNSDNGSLFIMRDWCDYYRSVIACYKDGDELKVCPLSFYIDAGGDPHWTLYNNVFYDCLFPVLYWMELPAPPAN